MSSAQPELKESLRRRDSAVGDGNGSARGVAALLHSFAEGRSKPKPKEQEVLDVATDYFLAHGYQGASINAMARSSGISKESIYRYFSSKKQLFEAVICRELAEYQTRLRRLSAEKTMDLREALINIGETVLDLVTMDRTLALRRLIFEEARRSPDVGQHYHRIGPEQAFAAVEEIFGPVLVAQRFDDINEVAALANDTQYGLSASIWSNDLTAVHRLIPTIRAGTVWVNTHGPVDANMPFGGFKHSGLGREHGRVGIEMYTELKSVCMFV